PSPAPRGPGPAGSCDRRRERMQRSHRRTVGRWCAVLAAVCPILVAATPARSEPAGAADALRDVRALADQIDRLVAARWADRGIQPAPPAGDAEFLRRVYLDLTGRIPPVAEVRRFLADPSPDKRPRLVERLLKSPLYAIHFTNHWRSLIVPDNGDFE